MHPSTSRGAALVIGVGPGLGASLCCALAAAGSATAGIGRSLKRESALAQHLRRTAPGFQAFALDVADEAALSAAVQEIEHIQGAVRVLIYNAAGFHSGSFEELRSGAFEAAWRTTCLGAMIAAREILPGMAARGEGAAIFTGATASLRGSAQFAAFASAKFALRGLVQSLAREYWPKNVHVAHTILDGLIGGGAGALQPDAVAASYLDLINQPKSAWTQELDLGPSLEKF
jgi:NAD(P)-dependent dehydrogenase (short-subunit alcohol dehydrogenase family)